MNRANQINCENMADKIAQIVQISPKIYDAFCQIDRSEFTGISPYAFRLDPQPLAKNQWISSPITVAKMTKYLELDNADSVLEIGCGSGYQAAILSKIVRRVFGVERIEKLAKASKEHFRNLGIDNVNVLYADGCVGWEKYAPYDRILFSACADEIDEKIFNQLGVGGYLVAPIKNGEIQQIVRFEKTALGIRDEILESCEFVPILQGIE